MDFAKNRPHRKSYQPTSLLPTQAVAKNTMTPPHLADPLQSVNAAQPEHSIHGKWSFANISVARPARQIVNNTVAAPVQRKAQTAIPAVSPHMTNQGESAPIQRIKDKDGQPVSFDLASGDLDKSGALKILQIITSGDLSANAEEMAQLMDIANPERLNPAARKDITGVEKSTFTTRIKEFDAAMDPHDKPGYVVPSAAELTKIRQKQAELKADGVTLTEDQAWSLVLAELRGEYSQEKNKAKAVQRLDELNDKWGTSYTEADLELILKHLKEGTLLATNYTFSRPGGANIGSNKSQQTLAADLMNDVRFKQVWETGTSQASADLERRGAVEESMGYGHALRRVQGAPLRQDRKNGAPKGEFAPQADPNISAEDAPKYGLSEMPNYAALVSSYQTHGVAPRYGKSVVYWKSETKKRATNTPGDSWNLAYQGALMSFASTQNPEVLFARTDDVLLRFAAAEATGKDQEFLAKAATSNAASTNSYIEVQIHGGLTWNDIDKIVIGEDEDDYMGLVKSFTTFRDQNKYTFGITTKKAI